MIFLVLSPIHKVLSLLCFHVSKCSSDLALCSYLETLLLFLIDVHWLHHLIILSLVFSVSCHFKMLIIWLSLPRFSFRNKSLSSFNTIDTNIPNNHHSAKCLKFWHSFLISLIINKLNMKQVQETFTALFWKLESTKIVL